MSDLNLVTLRGNVGQDPDVRGDGKVVSLRVATSETWTDRDGKAQEATSWHTVVCFRHMAERAKARVRKGSRVVVVGALKTRKWQDRDGNDRYTTEVVAESLTVLAGAKSEGSRGGAPHTSDAGGDFGDDSDIPF